MGKLCHGGEFERPARGNDCAQSLKRRCGLRLMHDALDDDEADAISLLCPYQPMAPDQRLPFGQGFACFGAIAK